MTENSRGPAAGQPGAVVKTQEIYSIFPNAVLLEGGGHAEAGYDGTSGGVRLGPDVNRAGGKVVVVNGVGIAISGGMTIGYGGRRVGMIEIGARIEGRHLKRSEGMLSGQRCL